MKPLFRSAIGALATAFCTISYGGVVVGDTMTCAVSGGGSFSCDSAQAQVGAGIEFGVGTPGFAALNVDFSANLLEITATADINLAFTVLHFEDLTNPLSSASFSSAIGMSGFDAGDITLSNGLLTIDLRETSWSQGSSVRVSLPHQSSGVPEPASLALVGAAFVGTLAARRRRTPTV